MSRKWRDQQARSALRGSPSRSRSPAALIAAGALLALAAVVVTVLLAGGLGRSESAAGQPVARNNVKGDPAAPVAVEDWSDFQ